MKGFVSHILISALVIMTMLSVLKTFITHQKLLHDLRKLPSFVDLNISISRPFETKQPAHAHALLSETFVDNSTSISRRLEIEKSVNAQTLLSDTEHRSKFSRMQGSNKPKQAVVNSSIQDSVLREPVIDDAAILIACMSGRENHEQRTAIRESWMTTTKNNPTFFFIGASACKYAPEHRSNHYSCTKKSIIAESQIDYKPWQTIVKIQDQRLAQERQAHGDIILLNMQDYYRALPKKLKLVYAWALQNTKAKWILKIDDDAFLYTEKLLSILKPLNSQQMIVIGSIRKNAHVPRDGKWKESSAYTSSTYPYFANGAEGHVISRTLADEIVKYDGYEYQGEDVSLGIWINDLSLAVQWKNLPGDFRNDGNCFKPAAVVGHQISAAKMKRCFKQASGRKLAPVQKLDIRHIKPLTIDLSKRFDIIIKTVYGFFLNRGAVPKFVHDMYRSHLKVWNDFKEPCRFLNQGDWFDASKPCIEKKSEKDFVQSFQATLQSIKISGFDNKKSLVPVSEKLFPFNGAHRIASSIVLGMDVIPVQRVNSKSAFNWDQNFFKQLGYQDKYADFAMLQWTIHVQKTVTVLFWPEASRDVAKMSRARKIVAEQCGIILYEKLVKVSERALANLVYHAYGDQEWLHAKTEQVSAMFGPQVKQVSVSLLFIIPHESTDMKLCKQKLRDFFALKVEKSSVHIPDYHTEATMIAEMVLNPNSIFYMHHHQGNQCREVSREISTRLELSATNPNSFLLPQDIMIDSGAAMSIFGIRARTDVDVLFEHQVRDDILGTKRGISIEPHTFATTIQTMPAVNTKQGTRHWGQEHLTGDRKSVHDLFHDPENYGYCHGLKFVSLNQLIRYKRERNEPNKDKADVNKILSFLASTSGIKLPNNDKKRSNEAYDTYTPKPDIVHGSGNYKLDKPTGKVPGSYSWSQAGQDKVIDKLLQEKQDGFFVEIGGYDGELHSNSMFFERNRNWRGLLVEANPYTYQQMLRRDRRCAMVNSCISSTKNEMEFKLGGGLTSAVETASAAHLKRIDSDAKTYGTNAQWQGHGQVVQVQCTTLDSLLKRLSVQHVDYFSLDVEGAEMLILNSIDWSKIKIDVMTIETQEHREEINKLMTAQGFYRIEPRKLAFDDIFVHRGFSRRLTTLTVPPVPASTSINPTHDILFDMKIWVCPSAWYQYLSPVIFDKRALIFTEASDVSAADILIAGQLEPSCEFPGKRVIVNAEHVVPTPPKSQNKFFLGAYTSDSPWVQPLYHVSIWFTHLHATHREYFQSNGLLRRLANTKTHFMIYMARNCIKVRDDAYINFLTVAPVHVAGKCPKRHSSDLVPPNIPSREKRDQNPHLFSSYRFVLCMENIMQDGYITEKILHAFISGSVPIYYGTREIFEIFNHRAFVYYDPENPSKAIEQVRYLEQNRTAYEGVVKEQIFRDGEQTLSSFFSLSRNVGMETMRRKLQEKILQSPMMSTRFGM